MQPQPGVGGVDGAVSFDGIGNQGAAGCYNLFGLPLKNAPDTLTGQNRHLGDPGFASVQFDDVARALSDGLGVLIQDLFVAFVIFKALSH